MVLQVITALLSIILYVQASALPIPVANRDLSALNVRPMGGGLGGEGTGAAGRGDMGGRLAGGLLGLGHELLDGGLVLGRPNAALWRRGTSGSSRPPSKEEGEDGREDGPDGVCCSPTCYPKYLLHKRCIGPGHTPPF